MLDQTLLFFTVPVSAISHTSPFHIFIYRVSQYLLTVLHYSYVTSYCFFVSLSHAVSSPSTKYVTIQSFYAVPLVLVSGLTLFQGQHTKFTLSSKVRIHKRLALSPELFSNAIYMISRIIKTVSLVNNAEILPLFL